MLVDDLDLIPLEHRHVDVLGERVPAMVLDHHESGLGDFDDATVPRKAARGAPDGQRPAGRDPEVNAPSFHCRSDARQRRRLDRHLVLEANGRTRLFGPDERDREPRDIPLLTTQAGPERPVQDGGKLLVRRQVREVLFGAGPGIVQVMGEVRVNRGCNPGRSGVGKISQSESSGKWGG